MRNMIFVSANALLPAGCATTKTAEKDLRLETPKPSYTEKVSAVDLRAFKPAASCPTDKKYESLEWRKMVSLANACVKTAQWNKVDEIGNALAVKAHLTPWGAYFMALAAEARKDMPRAAWMLELALKKAPNEGIFHYQLSRLHWEQGDDIAALKELKLAAELNSSLTDAHYVMGQMALQKESYSEAEKLFRKALAVDSRHVGATLAMASLRMKARDWAKAESALEDAIRLVPRNAQLRLSLAQVQETHLKKQVDALQTYKEIRSLAESKKLDDGVSVNVDEKIKSLEKATAQAVKDSKVSSRQPSAEGQVAK